ncbi:hypothetical protein FSP39_021101 [Pinctada imbricata]|uniref:COR domain-containing protein n=1 Tax=Pinctada imbricata TaxID=66713 RepID=A0AA89C2M0_PINIB|nr:hypothetical protein FSP39_021101 [Pinctada imbricata]
MECETRLWKDSVDELREFMRIFFVATIAIFGKRVMEWQNTGVNLGWSYWINCSSVIVMITALLTTYIAMKRKVIQIDDFEYNPDADQICLLSNDATNRGKLLLDAVIYNQTDIMLTLLRSGADPNMKVNDTTPLEEAATKGYGEATKYLLEAGAEVSREILAQSIGEARQDYTTVDLIKEQIYHAFSDVIENGQLILRDDLFLNATDLSEEKLSFIRDIMVECGESYPEYGETLPGSWMSLHEAMRTLKGKGQKIAMLGQIHELNKQLKRPMASDELNVCLLFFHEIGYILYFAENALRGTIILDPKVMIDAMKCIITCQDFVSIFWGSSEWKMMVQEGKVLRSYIEKVWKNVRKKEPFHKYRQHLLMTMEKLDLICTPKVYDDSAREEQESFYYIPCMVQKTVEMEDIMQSENAVSFTYNFEEVLPPAVYHRLVASCLSLWQVYENHIYHDLIILRSGNFHLLQLKRDIKTVVVTLQHLRGLSDIDINFCRVIKRFISETIDYNLGTYITIKGMNLYKVEFNQSARSYMLFTNEMETKNGNEETCPPSCRGPLVDGMENEVSEMCLMRIACSLNMEQLHPLAANLLGSVAFLTEAEEDFPEFRQKDLAFFILHKWKNILVERRSKPTMRILSDHFADADLSPHILCKVCECCTGRLSIQKDNCILDKNINL